MYDVEGHFRVAEATLGEASERGYLPINILLTATNWWPSSAHLAIGLAKAGCRVAAVYPRSGHPLAKTKAVTARYPYRSVLPLRSLAKAVRNARPDLIIPCDDRAAGHLHCLHAIAIQKGEQQRPLAEFIERSLGEPTAFPIVRSRANLLRLARKEHVPVPEMRSVTSTEELIQWSFSNPFPWVMKVDRSWGGSGVKIIRGLAEAVRCFERMSKPLATSAMLKRLIVNRDPYWIESWWRWSQPGITVQSFIDGFPANCSVFCWKGEVVAGISVHVVAAQGATGPATIVRVTHEEQMLNAAQTLARCLSLSGFHGFDFMIDRRTEKAFLVELNPRAALPCHLRFGENRDLIGALCAKLMPGESVHCSKEIVAETVAYFPQAWLSDPESEVLAAQHHDVPWSEPELLKELLLIPWPDRSWLAQYSDRIRKMKFEDRPTQRFSVLPVVEPRSVLAK